MGLSLGKGNR